MNEQYIQTPKRLLKATHARNNGVLVELTPTIKTVWIYMFERWSFFKSGNKEYFENQESIAGELGLDRRTLIRMFPKLEEAGIIKVFKQKVVGGKKESNRYTFILDPLKCELLCNGAVLKESDFPLGKPQTPPKAVQEVKKQAYVKEVNPFDFDDDPF